MNIKMQCCGIILLGVVYYFYRNQNKLNLNTEKAFLQIFSAITAGLIFDVASMIVLRYNDYLPVHLVNLICKLYVATLVIVAYSGLIYVCSDIFTDREFYKKRVIIYSIMAVIGIILVLSLPIYKNLDDISNEFTYGPSVVTTYVFCMTYFGIIVYLLFRYKAQMNLERRTAVMFWIVLWLLCAIIQFFYNRLLLVGYAGAISVLVIYLRLENPENNVDRRTGFFTIGALVQYLEQVFGNDDDSSLIDILISTPFVPNDRKKDMLINQEVIDFLASISHTMVFKGDSGRFIITMKPKDYERVEKLIDERFEDGWGPAKDFITTPNIVVMPSIRVCEQANDILPCIRYTRNTSIDLAETSKVELNKTLAAQMYKEQLTEQMIADAIAEDRIVVYYQPIYSTEEKKFVSAEALVRIFDAEGKLIPPGVFIGIAEQNGMILKIGEMVFKKVCQFIAEKLPEQYGLEYIEVNLSTIQGSYEFLAESFIEIMDWYNVDPSMINLEITESGSVSAKKVLLDNMNKLIDYGVGFSLDDFGTGQSNLNYVVDMPVELVKFDRDMIVSYFENGKAKYVMDAAMHMIHGLKLKIVSEGIETKEMLDTMEKLGINYIQGYYFSKPIPEDEFLKFIKEKNK
ncbi:MAG: EAL domain-containing protein [Lachnospiraceae bacterium]|nr:EAL domain-containing protein [Lachnospiraceae bacterium]